MSGDSDDLRKTISEVCKILEVIIRRSDYTDKEYLNNWLKDIREKGKV